MRVLKTSLVLLGALLCPFAPSHSQTIALKKINSDYWLQASAPVGKPHNVQVSNNLHLWIDVRESLEDNFSFALPDLSDSEQFYRLLPTPDDPPPIRVCMIGDSMIADCCGWGLGLPNYFKASATVVNYAEPWTSTKLFLTSAEMDKMLLIRPDYVLIQFAWSDGSDDPDRGTTAVEFADNMRSIVQTVRGFNGTPILVTLQASRIWDSQGKLVPSDHRYNAITRQLAVELHTPLIDMYQISSQLFQQLGQSGSAFFEWMPGDDTHVSATGSVYLSRLAARYLPDAVGPYLTRVFEPPPAH